MTNKYTINSETGNFEPLYSSLTTSKDDKRDIVYFAINHLKDDLWRLHGYCRDNEIYFDNTCVLSIDKYLDDFLKEKI